MALLRRLTKQILGQESLSLKHVFALFSFIFVIWSLYRYFPESIPDSIEELILKPIIWLIPTFWMVTKIEGKSLSSLGLTKKNLFPSIYWGLGLGIVFALEGLLTNLLKYGGLTLPDNQLTPLLFLGGFLLAVATAFSEEIVFRGYIFQRLASIWKKEWLAALVSSLLFVLIHLPVGIFVLGYTPMVMLAFLFLVFVFGLGSAFVFARTKNIAASILLHLFWSWPIILFK